MKPTDMPTNRTIFAYSAIGGFLVFVFSVFAAVPAYASKDDGTPMEFFTFSQMSMPEQDVFVELANSDSLVLRAVGRNTTDAGILSQALYTSSEPLARDPYETGDSPLGPVRKGTLLGLTLGNWIAATGTGLYRPGGDRPDMSLDFTRLVPSGVYSVWCGRVGLAPAYSLRMQPCTQDSGPATFVANNEGVGTVHIPLASSLEPSSRSTASAVFVFFHSNRAVPQSLTEHALGVTVHQQLLWILPVYENIEDMQDAQEMGSSQWILWGLAVLFCFVAFWFILKRPLTGGSG